MPGMSGRELTQRLSFLRPEMKILYMSGYSDDSIVYFGILDEKVSFIPKPFSLEALVNKVREALDK
ncbi:MAG: response regulator [Proteobacteria bacterium]|nr:response regulator [Pseudomonadota bacterium]